MKTMGQKVLKYPPRKWRFNYYWHVALKVYTLSLKFKRKPALVFILVIDAISLVSTFTYEFLQ